MDHPSLVDAVQEILSPAMAKRGFGPGGPGSSPDGTRTFLYCTGASDFASRWPETVDVMRVRTQIDDEEPSACLDLTVEISPTDKIERVEFEFVGLDRLLVDLGRDDVAERCSASVLRNRGLEAAAQIREAVEILMPVRDST